MMGHCWVKVGNFILDVTADQFAGMKAIVWGKQHQFDDRYCDTE